MSWKEVSVVDLRIKFVALALAEGANITALCEDFNVGRTTAYKWLKRYKSEGGDGMNNQSRRPHTSPNRTALEPEGQILALNIEHTGWGRARSRDALNGAAAPCRQPVRFMPFSNAMIVSTLRQASSNLSPGLNTSSPMTCGKWTLKAMCPCVRVAAIH